MLVATGGIGGNHELVRRWWPERLGTPPREMIAGVPASVDGSGIELAAFAMIFALVIGVTVAGVLMVVGTLAGKQKEAARMDVFFPTD